jgi:hypothetical protein
MGLQDRDYYREQYRRTSRSANPGIHRSGRNASGINYLLYPLITVATRCLAHPTALLIIAYSMQMAITWG